MVGWLVYGDWNWIYILFFFCTINRDRITCTFCKITLWLIMLLLLFGKLKLRIPITMNMRWTSTFFDDHRSIVAMMNRWWINDVKWKKKSDLHILIERNKNQKSIFYLSDFSHDFILQNSVWNWIQISKIFKYFNKKQNPIIKVEKPGNRDLKKK